MLELREFSTYIYLFIILCPTNAVLCANKTQQTYTT